MMSQADLRNVPFVFGCGGFGESTDQPAAERLVDAALDGGWRLFETSPTHAEGEGESMLGRILAAGGGRRDAQIATRGIVPLQRKGQEDPAALRTAIVEQCEDSLGSLQRETIDLWQVNWPHAEYLVGEVVDTVERLRESGKIRAWGWSALPAWQFEEFASHAARHPSAPFVSLATPLNLLDRRFEAEFVGLAQRFEVTLLGAAPLAAGVLSGRYSDSEKRRPSADSRLTPQHFGKGAQQIVAALRRIAERRGRTPAQIALEWAVRRGPQVRPVIRIRSTDQLTEAQAVQMPVLDDEDLAILDAAAPPGSHVVEYAIG